MKGFDGKRTRGLRANSNYGGSHKKRRSPDKKWVQPLDGAFGSIMDVLSNVRVLANVVLDYLPRYHFEVCLIEPENGIYPSEPYVHSVDFCSENVLQLDVSGCGWESASSEHLLDNRENILALKKDVQTRRNVCGFLDWENRWSAIPDRNPPSYVIRLYETESGKEETQRWLKDHKEELDEDDYAEMSREARLWERSITGGDDQKDVMTSLLKHKNNIPEATVTRLNFQFDEESPTQIRSVSFHVSYDSSPDPREHLYMHLISAQLFVPLPPSTLIPH